MKRKIIILLAAFCFFCGLKIWYEYSLGAKEYETAIGNNFEYLEECDYKNLLVLGKPREIAEELSDKLYHKSLMERASLMDPVYEVFWEALKEEEELWVEEEVTFRLAYEILKAESLEALDQLSDSVNWDFEDFIYIMDSNYGNFDFEAEKIQNAYAVEVQYNLIKEQVDWRGQVTFHAKLFEDTVIMLLYEYENQWYIYEDNIVTIFNLLDNITSLRVRGNFYEAYDAACERLLEN